MNHLQVIQHNGIEVVDSREVAEMVGKQHKELLRDIRNYAEIIEGSNERNKGCDMVANKMTGEKGVEMELELTTTITIAS